MTALIFAATATALALTTAILAVWTRHANPHPKDRSARLSRRDRVEVVARLWVPR
jgi:hypothetical protein